MKEWSAAIAISGIWYIKDDYNSVFWHDLLFDGLDVKDGLIWNLYL